MEVKKILKKGDSFVAYNENGDSMGRISIKTKKFVGNTDALIPLNEHLKNNPATKKKKRVWTVIFLDSEGEQIEETQIDEKKASLAWSLFEEFGHEKKKGMKLEWQPEWEFIED